MSLEEAPLPVLINDLSSRDAPQSLLATRMRIQDSLQVVRENAKAGFHALEVWGGATFDVAIRYLGENPWENLRQIKAAVKKSAEEAGVPETPLMMLLRSQTAVGYKNYPDDVVRAFVRKSAENGMNIFRVFDGLNDMRNIMTTFDELTKCQKDGLPVEKQGVICYTTGPVDENADETATPLQKQKIFNLDYYLGKARELKEMGADTLCLKDMAGLMEPDVAAELIPAIKRETGLKVTLHMHAGMGLSDATLMRAIKSGVDVIDVANAGLASGSGHTSAQMLLDMMERSDDPSIRNRMPKIAQDSLKKVREFFLYIRPKYAKWEGKYNPGVQKKTHEAQIPGGMLSNFESQIKGQLAGRKDAHGNPLRYETVLELVLEEVPKVRADLGWPPLVTPCSQIVGVQAVNNVFSVLSGQKRYTQASEETQRLALGELGATPVEPNTNIVVMMENITGRKRVSHRPADDLKPGFQKARELLIKAGIDQPDDESIITAALWDSMGVEFVSNGKWLQNEPEPVLPAHMTLRSGKDRCVAFGDVHAVIGSHMIEAIAQTAKEINRIEDGFFLHLSPEELDYRLQKYRGFIARHLSSAPKQLKDAGFSRLQVEWAIKGGPVESFNKLIRERCVALGVRSDSIPQVTDLDLRRAYETAVVADGGRSKLQPQPLAAEA